MRNDKQTGFFLHLPHFSCLPNCKRVAVQSAERKGRGSLTDINNSAESIYKTESISQAN